MSERWYLHRVGQPFTTFGWGQSGWASGGWGAGGGGTLSLSSTGWGVGGWAEGGWGEGSSGSATLDDDLESVYVRHGINPFANKADVRLDDPNGTKVSAYPRATLVELDVEIPGVLSKRRRFAGFVQDHTQERNETELLVLSHDFWIRTATDVFADYTDTPISDILADLVPSYTPLTYEPSLVDVENDIAITREWTGEPLENILDELRVISGGNELFGATFDREFYFRALTNETSPRSFNRGEYLETKWKRDGKNAANRAVVTYGTGGAQATVTRNDAEAQRALQESIDADEPVRIPVRKNRSDITTEARAIDFADWLLEQRAELLTGTIETWEAFVASPGELTPVVDPDNDVEDEFRIAQLEYEWPGGDPPTTVTAADKAIDTVDELVALSDEVQRLNLQGVDPDAPFLETIVETLAALTTATATVLLRTFGSDRFDPGFGRDDAGFGRVEVGIDVASTSKQSADAKLSRAGLNALRDGWRDEAIAIADEARVGSGDSRASRNDVDLDDQLGTAEASISLPDDQTVRWTALIRVDGGVQEVGIGPDGGDLYARSVLDVALEATAADRVDVSLLVEIGDDPDERGVLTETGATAARDILGDNAPEPPTQIAIGTGETEPDVSDTSLETQVAVLAITADPTAGVGSVRQRTRFAEATADGESITELALLDANDDALTRLLLGPIEKGAFEFETTQEIAFANP